MSGRARPALAVDQSFPPVAVVNQRLAEVQAAGPEEVRIGLPPAHPLERDNELILTFDPYAVVRLNLRT